MKRVRHESGRNRTLLLRQAFKPEAELPGFVERVGNPVAAQENGFRRYPGIFQKGDDEAGALVPRGIGVEERVLVFSHDKDAGTAPFEVEAGCPGGSRRDLAAGDDCDVT